MNSDYGNQLLILVCGGVPVLLLSYCTLLMRYMDGRSSPSLPLGETPPSSILCLQAFVPASSSQWPEEGQLPTPLTHFCSPRRWCDAGTLLMDHPVRRPRREMMPFCWASDRISYQMQTLTDVTSRIKTLTVKYLLLCARFCAAVCL